MHKWTVDAALHTGTADRLGLKKTHKSINSSLDFLVKGGKPQF